MIEIMYAVSAGILGVFAGTQLAEGALLVPQWKSMDPAEFFQQHKVFGKKLYHFFAPLTILSTLIPIATAIYSFMVDAPGKLYAGSMVFFVLLFFSTYFLYFKSANQSFADESLTHKELPAELRRWGNWHWGRVCLEFVALICCLIALI